MEVSYGDLVLCSGHYRRYERARNRWIVANKREPGSKAKATILAGVRESGELRRRLVDPIECSCGCGRLAEKRGLSNRCYMRALRAGDIVTKPKG